MNDEKNLFYSPQGISERLWQRVRLTLIDRVERNNSLTNGSLCCGIAFEMKKKHVPRQGQPFPVQFDINFNIHCNL